MMYTIHRCLAELKTLDSRITKATRNLNVVGIKKGSSDKVLETSETVPQFKESVLSDYESIRKLISNRDKIKKAIVLSNATTMVTVGGHEYTVAEAIERKQSISYEINLLNKLKDQYRNTLSTINHNNSIMENNLERQENTMRENGLSVEDIKMSTELYRKQNGYEMINPLNIKSTIKELEDYIDAFETEVDHVLSTSNAITVVEIDLD